MLWHTLYLSAEQYIFNKKHQHPWDARGRSHQHTKTYCSRSRTASASHHTRVLLIFWLVWVIQKICYTYERSMCVCVFGVYVIVIVISEFLWLDVDGGWELTRKQGERDLF